jgi:hypothetical protein
MIWVILICGVRCLNHINLLFKVYIEKAIFIVVCSMCHPYIKVKDEII